MAQWTSCGREDLMALMQHGAEGEQGAEHKAERCMSPLNLREMSEKPVPPELYVLDKTRHSSRRERSPARQAKRDDDIKRFLALCAQWKAIVGLKFQLKCNAFCAEARAMNSDLIRENGDLRAGLRESIPGCQRALARLEQENESLKEDLREGLREAIPGCQEALHHLNEDNGVLSKQNAALMDENDKLRRKIQETVHDLHEVNGVLGEHNDALMDDNYELRREVQEALTLREMCEEEIANLRRQLGRYEAAQRVTAFI
jgi:hypothetical protein